MIFALASHRQRPAANDDHAASVTYAHEVTARGFFGALRQRGLQITHHNQHARPTIALTAYTDSGASAAARLEIPVDDVRQLARILLDLADQADQQHRQPTRCSLSEVIDQRRAG